MKLLKIPFNQGSMGKNPGTDKAPDAVVKALEEIYVNEAGRKSVFEVVGVDLPSGDIEGAHQKIVEVVTKEKPAIILGGDHAMSYSTVKAVAAQHLGMGLLVFDAHPDCMQSFNPPTHENFLRCLIEDGIIDANKVVLVGIRAMDGEELAFLRQHNIKCFFMKEIAQEGFQDVCFAVMAAVREWPALYVSVDIDAVDPAFAPGTGYLEPGGLTSRELLFFIQKLTLLKNIKCFDLVEISPDKDVQGMTAKLGAKIISEL